MEVTKRDHEATFHALYDTYHQAVYAYHLARTNDEPTAADLLQETFMRVWRHMDRAVTLTEEQQRYWLFHIAKNVTIGHYRRAATRKSRMAVTGLDPTGTAADDVAADFQWAGGAAPSPSQAYETKETLHELDQAIRRLPDDWRLALMMHVMGGLTSAEIGRILGKPAGTVRYHISQARQRLIDELAVGTGTR